MRYIGSKINLLEIISPIIYKKSHGMNDFCDIFSGTGAVGRYFKESFTVTSNDLLYFSFVLQKATIECNIRPIFKDLKKVIGVDPFNYFKNLDINNYNFKTPPFIFENYSPNDLSKRQYLTNDNALKIDAMRQIIEQWFKDGHISEIEYFYILAGIIESVPFVSNIAGTYGAFLKHWDKRANLSIDAVELPIKNNKKANRCFNLNANDLVNKINGDILYIDPPYNGRQYLPNYHLLETIARYDYPEIKGITGLRSNDHGISDYCKKGKVLNSFDDLIASSDFKLLVISYSNEGIMKEEEIAEILKKHGNPKTLEVTRIPYRRYKRTKLREESNLNELLFTIYKS
jgi:adenine-specific DNA-methyltransferase